MEKKTETMVISQGMMQFEESQEALIVERLRELRRRRPPVSRLLLIMDDIDMDDQDKVIKSADPKDDGVIGFR